MYMLTTLLAAAGSAPCAAEQTATDLGCIPNDPVGFVGEIYKFGIGLIGGVALISIIVGGYFILTSKGNPEQLSRGKGYIMYAVIGLLLAVFGFVFTELVFVDILELPGFSK